MCARGVFSVSSIQKSRHVLVGGLLDQWAFETLHMNFKFKRETCRFRTEDSRNISLSKCGTLFVSASESSLNAFA